MWTDLAAVCGTMVAAELLARLFPKDSMVAFVKGLVILTLAASFLLGLFHADWEVSLQEQTVGEYQSELTDYVNDRLEASAREELERYFEGLLDAAGLKAEKILMVTDIGENGSIVLRKAGFLFRYDSDAQRARALLSQVLESEIELEVEVYGR